MVVLALGLGSVACGGDEEGLDPGTSVGPGGDGDVPGPEVAPADAVAETGCGCSTSRNLQALSCAAGDGVPIAGTGGLELASSGDIALFTLCYSGDGQFPVDHCRAFRWTRTGGSEALVDAGYHVGLADDGSALVVATQDRAR